MSFDYDVFPKVFSLGSEATISICAQHDEFCGRFLDKRFKAGEVYNLSVFSKVEHSDKMDVSVKADKQGLLKFKMKFNTKGEYFIDIKKKNDEDNPLSEERIFVVDSEMMKLRPYKGDLHIHTSYTDGRKSPIQMAVKAKDYGMDFIAITDHDRYFPSLEAIDKTKQMKIDLLVFQGEEISVQDSVGSGSHVVSLCASEHVKGKFSPDNPSAEEYDKEIKDIIDNDLKDKKLIKGLNKEKYSHLVWVIKKIRQFGGYVLLAHPYWEYPRGKYYLDRLVFDQLIADGLFDFIEISINTDLSIAKCFSEVSRGKKIIPISTSDGHDYFPSSPRYGKYYTIVFADKLDKKNIFKALFESKCVAVGHHPGDYESLFGSFELVEYSDFLMREFFPLHDRICHLESELYMRVIEGENKNNPMLDKLRKELVELYKKYWA